MLIAKLSFRRKTMTFDYETNYSIDFTQIRKVKLGLQRRDSRYVKLKPL